MSRLSWLALLTSASLSVGICVPAFSDYTEDIPTTLKRYEIALFGQVKSGPILDRVKALEKNLWKKPQDGSLPERLDRIGQMLSHGSAAPITPSGKGTPPEPVQSAVEDSDSALPPPAPAPPAFTPPPARPPANPSPSAQTPPANSPPPAPADKQRLASTMLEQAMATFKRGNAAEAQRLFLAVLKLDPNNVDAYYNLGVIAETRKDYASARTYYQKALKNSPGDRDLSDAVKQMDRLLSTPAYAPR